MRAIAALGLAAFSLCGASFARPATAADLAYPAPPVYNEPDPQFEFGTGWYLRGDVGYSNATAIEPFGAIPKLTSPTDWTGDVGAGYRWGSFRTDLTVGFDGYQHLSGQVPDVTCAYTLTGQYSQTTGLNTGYFWTPAVGTCNGHNQGSILKTDVLVNGYYDLGTWSGLTPYVGAGVGFARFDTKTETNYYKTSDGTVYNPDLTPTSSDYPLVWRDVYGNVVKPTVPTTGLPVGFTKQNWSASTHRTKYNFAWALMAGVAYAVDNHLSIDLGYRYLNLGSYQDGLGHNKTIDAQQVRLGMRYAID